MKTKTLIGFIICEYTLVFALLILFCFKVSIAKKADSAPIYLPPVESSIKEEPQVRKELTPAESVDVILTINEKARHRINYNEAIDMYYTIRYWTTYHDLPFYDFLGMAAQESHFSPFAYRKDTKATGIFQITPIALNDFNAYTGNSYTMNDMYDIDKNTEVACWFYKRQITYMNNYGIDWTHDDLIITYNSGIGNFKKNIDSYRESYDYLTKVKGYAVAFK